jgi:SsrA-binding protein
MAKHSPTKKPSDDGTKLVCRNRSARHEYEIIEKVEAGLVLVGSEVKSLRNGKASIEEAFGRIQDDELWLVGCDIPIYREANVQNHDPKRKRKLLLHRREIKKLLSRVTERGFTLVPLRLYFKRGKAKVEIAVARGRKTHDKRERLKAESARRDIRRAMNARR